MSNVVEWFRLNEPVLYKIAVKRHALKNGRPAIYGLSAIEENNIVELSGSDKGFLTTLTETFKQLAEPVIAYKSQRDILKAQLKRGQQGLPPLMVDDYSPVIKVSPSIGPDSEAALTRIATKTTGNFVQKYGLYIAGGLLAALFLLRRKRG